MITFQCACGRAFEVQDELAGRQATCRGCGSAVVVPGKQSPPAPPAPPTNVTPAGELWHYAVSGRSQGTATPAQLAAMQRQGTLGRDTMVWRQGMAAWMPLAQAGFAAQAPALTAGVAIAPHNNALLWVLAFAPIIGLFAEGIIAGVTRSRVEKLWFITIAINIGLCVADTAIAKRAGHDTSKYSGWAILVPVYLYLRIKAAESNIAPFVIWLVCFAVVLIT